LEYNPKKIIVSKRTYPKKIKSKNIIKIFTFILILNFLKKSKKIKDPSIKKVKVNIIVILMIWYFASFSKIIEKIMKNKYKKKNHFGVEKFLKFKEYLDLNFNLLTKNFAKKKFAINVSNKTKVFIEGRILIIKSTKFS
jgi:hypothetical protein